MSGLHPPDLTPDLYPGWFAWCCSLCKFQHYTAIVMDIFDTTPLFDKPTADWLVKECDFAAADKLIANVRKSRFATIGSLLDRFASKTTMLAGLTAKEATYKKNIFRADQVKVFQQAQLLKLLLALEKEGLISSEDASVATDKPFIVPAKVRRDLELWKKSSDKRNIDEISVEPLELTKDNVLMVRLENSQKELHVYNPSVYRFFPFIIDTPLVFATIF